METWRSPSTHQSFINSLAVPEVALDYLEAARRGGYLNEALADVKQAPVSLFCLAKLGSVELRVALSPYLKRETPKSGDGFLANGIDHSARYGGKDWWKFSDTAKAHAFRVSQGIVGWRYALYKMKRSLGLPA